MEKVFFIVAEIILLKEFDYVLYPHLIVISVI